MKKLKDSIIGVVAAILFVGLIIYAIEDQRSLIQMLIGFVLFIFPFSFISSFNSKITSFLFSAFVISFCYFCYKIEYYDFWLGVVEAAIIGGSIYFYRVRKTETFSTKDYIEKANKK